MPVSHFLKQAAALMAIMLASASCNLTDSLSGCTLIGCNNGLNVHLSTLPSGPITVEYLVDGVVQGEANCGATAPCQQDYFFKTTATERVSIRVTTNTGARVTEFDRVRNLQPTDMDATRSHRIASAVNLRRLLGG